MSQTEAVAQLSQVLSFFTALLDVAFLFHRVTNSLQIVLLFSSPFTTSRPLPSYIRLKLTKIAFSCD